jgi:thiol-disulfide isomerase/thioredoxin
MLWKKLALYPLSLVYILAHSTINARPQPKKNIAKPVQASTTKAYTDINSLNEFQKLINSNKPTVLLFYAPWCGACNSMIPVFNAGAQKYKGKAEFIAIDVTKDHLKDPVDMFGIQGIPTVCYKEVGLKTTDQFNARLVSLCGAPTTTPKAPAKKAVPVNKKAPAKVPLKTVRKKAPIKRPLRKRTQRKS